MIEGDVSGALLEVTIDRVSGSGNFVAEEEWKGNPILVKQTEVGETMVVKLFQKDLWVLGRRVRTPSAKQMKVARDRRERIRDDASESLQEIGNDLSETTEGQSETTNNRISEWEGLDRNAREEQNLGRD